MGLRSLWRRIALVIFLAPLLTGTVYSQENAVGGSVRAKKGRFPLPGVRVTVAQKDEIYDNTRDGDGVYVLLVPKSIKKIDLVYEHQGFLTARDTVTNEQAQNKRPIVYMRSNDPESIGALSESELEIVAGETASLIDINAEYLPALAKAGRDNQLSLLAAALKIKTLALQNAAEGNNDEAESKLLRCISIQEKVAPNTGVLAQTYDDYAQILKQGNKLDKAAEMMFLAAEARSNAPESFVPDSKAPINSFGQSAMFTSRHTDFVLVNRFRSDAFGKLAFRETVGAFFSDGLYPRVNLGNQWFYASDARGLPFTDSGTHLRGTYNLNLKLGSEDYDYHSRFGMNTLSSFNLFGNYEVDPNSELVSFIQRPGLELRPLPTGNKRSALALNLPPNPFQFDGSTVVPLRLRYPFSQFPANTRMQELGGTCSATPLTTQERSLLSSNSGALPNLTEATVFVLGAGTNYGRLPVPLGAAKEFRVYATSAARPSLEIVNEDVDGLDVVVLDQQSVRVARGASHRILEWPPGAAGLYTVRVSNKNSNIIDLIVRLSSKPCF